MLAIVDLSLVFIFIYCIKYVAATNLTLHYLHCLTDKLWCW